MENENEVSYGYTVEKETYRVYKVVNHNSGKVYRVWINSNGKYTCTCPAFEIHPKACKHIKMILRLEGKI